MSCQDVGLRIRTQSSYEFSLASSRSSKFFSSESLILDDSQLSRGRYVQMFSINQKTYNSKTSMQRLFEPLRKAANPNSKTEYIVMYEYEQNPNAENTQKTLQKQKSKKQDPKKKQLSNTLAFYPNYYRNHQTFLSSIPLPTLNLINSYKRCSLIPQNDFIDRAYGAMFGFVIGDSVGSYLIHKNITEIGDICTALEMKNGGRFSLSPGQGTDQTQLCLTLSQGLLQSFEHGDYDKNIVAKKYLDWIQSQPFDFPTLVAISFSEIRKQQRIQSQKMLGCSFLEQSLTRGSLRNINHQSSLSLIRIIPIVLISIHSQQERLIGLIKQEMNFFTPNAFATQVSILYGILLRQIILTNDHQLAIHQASKWVYNNGSDKLIELWKLFQQGKQITINSMNMNHVSVPFLFALNAINKKQISFIDSIFKILIKGYNTDTNCSIVMGLVGAVIGLNRIPNFYKNKVIDCQAQNSKRKRNKMYCSSSIVDLVPQLINCSKKYQQEKNSQ